MNTPQEIIIFVFIMLIFFWLGFLAVLIRKRRQILMEIAMQPVMRCQLKCSKCGFKAIVPWYKGDYVMKEASYAHYDLKTKKLCEGKVFIDGIYLDVPMTKEEKKYKELCDKWR
jgi:hypothetical protein